MSHDVYTLPPDLPVPEDDGAADHLTGLALPDLELDSSQGRVSVRDFDVIYLYPRTSRPGVPLPPGWDEMPGARGCTPQSCAFRDLYPDLGVPVAGLSAQTLEDQLEFAERFPEYGVEGEVYVTAPGAEIDEEHELVAAIDASHAEVFGEPPGRDVTRWFSDASALTRYGVPTVNYGTSTGLMDVELGENLEIDGLVSTAEIYAHVAMNVCGVA